MSEPRKHHYVPVCYLKQWADTEDRRLCEHKLIPAAAARAVAVHALNGPGGRVAYPRPEIVLYGLPIGQSLDTERRFPCPSAETPGFTG